MATSRLTASGDAIYARFSSELQNPRSIPDQVERLRGEIAKHAGQPDADLVSVTARRAVQCGSAPGCRHACEPLSRAG